jgi:superfamily II DNA/RNA helicase
MGFADFGLSELILKALREKEYTRATPIQIKAIPLVSQGKDIIATAQTGTGKTASFLLPILQLLIKIEKTKPKQEHWCWHQQENLLFRLENMHVSTVNSLRSG